MLVVWNESVTQSTETGLPLVCNLVESPREQPESDNPYFLRGEKENQPRRFLACGGSEMA